MRHRIIAVVILAGIFFTSSCFAQTPIEGGHWLLDSLLQMNAEGVLFEPSRVEAILHVQLETSQQEGVLQPAACSNPGSNRSLTVIQHQSHPNWLRPTAEGIKDMPVPAFFINKAGVSGEPTFSYTEYRAKACDERHTPPDTREANLSISGLPEFACLTRDDVAKRQGSESSQATDGVDLVVFTASDNDQKAATLTFVYRAGAPCALSAEIRQDYKFGYRYQRAAAKWQACSAATKRSYCALNGPIIWSDDKKIGAMEEAGISACGSLPSAYAEEPVSGPSPPKRRRTFFNPKGPCPED